MTLAPTEGWSADSLEVFDCESRRPSVFDKGNDYLAAIVSDGAPVRIKSNVVAM
jgi:hypothetical protein